MNKKYAILIKPHESNNNDLSLIDYCVCDVSEVKNMLKWYYKAIKCDTIGHSVRSLNGKYYDFVYDDEFLLKENHPLTLASYDLDEVFCGRVVMLPFEHGSEDFVYFNDNDLKDAIEDLAYCQVESVSLQRENKFYNVIKYDF